jgi:hypothetical protein
MADGQLDQVSAKDTVLGVLNYVDSPFKLGVVVLLAVMTFCGYFIYANQETLLGAWQRESELPKLNSSRYEDAAKLIMKATGADMVVILSVNPILNRRTVERMYSKDGARIKEFDGMKIPLFSKNEANNSDVVKLMASEVPCGEYKTPRSELGYFYISRGMSYSCRVSAPPTIDAFVGQITALWKVKPEIDPTNFLIIGADMIATKK